MNEAIRQDIRDLTEIIQDKYNTSNLKELEGYQNFVYQGTINDRDCILRITDSSHRSRAELQAELAFIELLATNGVPVARPIKVASQEYIGEIRGSHGTYWICAFEKAKGLSWREKPQTATDYFHAGKALGRLHRISQGITADFARKSWQENQYLQLAQKLLPDERLTHRLSELCQMLDDLPQTRESYGLVHGDYSFGNMLYDTQGITIIDFDECEYNWFIYDIAVYLFYYLLGADPKHMDIEPNKQLFSHFMAGYLTENRIDEFWIAKLPLFFRLREFILLASIYRSFYPNKLGKWQKAYIAVSEHRMMNRLPFVDIDYQALFSQVSNS